jgi:hypothetical protein
MSFNPSKSAMIALGKFYLHRWDKHVLVDWAESMIAKGHASDSMHFLSAMRGDGREFQLEQFFEVCRDHNLVVYDVEELALEAYISDLRKRVIAGEIEPEAAFAQVRPLAYDEEIILVSGLDELDQDLNLLDSAQPVFYNKDLTLETREEVIRRFFREFTVDTEPSAKKSVFEDTDPADTPPPFFDENMLKQIEMVAIIFVSLIFVVWILLFLLTVVGGFTAI